MIKKIIFIIGYLICILIGCIISITLWKYEFYDIGVISFGSLFVFSPLLIPIITLLFVIIGDKCYILPPKTKLISYAIGNTVASVLSVTVLQYAGPYSPGDFSNLNFFVYFISLLFIQFHNYGIMFVIFVCSGFIWLYNQKYDGIRR